MSQLAVGAASGLALASGAGWSPPAQAHEWGKAGDIGLFAAIHFDARREIHFGFGMEARGVFIERMDGCMETPQLLFSGAVARAEVIGWKQTRLTLGPVIGSTDGALGYSIDATGGFSLGTDRGWVGAIGLDGTAFTLPNARLGFTIGRDATVGLGFRGPPLVPHEHCVVGRPLRRGDGRAPAVGGRTVVLTSRRGSDQGDGERGGDGARRGRAAREWMRRACAEWASVPTFHELAEQLHAAGAPQELWARARDAAADELRHALLSAELSRVLSGALTVELDPPVTTSRPAVGGRDAVIRLAMESWQDGCLGEGGAAALAAREAHASVPPVVGRAQRSIAVDEKKHAELAWDVIEWLLRVDPASARPLLERAASGALAPPASSSTGGDVTAPSGLDAIGILDSGRAAPVLADADLDARLRLVARLGA